jgi:hypothetical protein
MGNGSTVVVSCGVAILDSGSTTKLKELLG